LSPTQSKQSCDDILLTAKLSGNLPDLPTTDDLIQGWQKDSEDFSHFILNEVAPDAAASLEPNAELVIEPIDCSVTVDLSLTNTQVFDASLYSNSELDTLKTVLPQSVTVNTKLLIIAGKLVFYRSSSAKAKDLFTLYLHQLILQVAQADESQTHADVLGTVVSSHGYYFDTKTQKPSEFNFSDIVDAKLQLQRLVATFYLGQHQPLLLNGDIVEKIRKSKVFEQTQFEQLWSDSNTFQAFGEDAYIQYFWPRCPNYDDISPKLLNLYQPMLDALQVVKSSAKPSVKKGAK
jgi:exodeoxyribonuclease V gamma subunit